MQKTFFSLFLILYCIGIYANDGAYYVNGNQLIPISETDISVKKEILTIERINEKYARIKVYYEFYNPSKSKSLIVGFEADSPEGDVSAFPVKGEHPYISNFSAKINKQNLTYQVAKVDTELYLDRGYVKNNKINQLSPEEVIKRSGDEFSDFCYVYYFDAMFKKGINIVEHTYTVKLSGSVDHDFSLRYVLTAANRWANKQIDDFTLIIDMGESTVFQVEDKPFGANPQWIIEGLGSKSKRTSTFYYPSEDRGDRSTTHFRMEKGKAVFKQMNFKPKAELWLYSPNHFLTFDAAKMDLSGTKPIEDIFYSEAVDDFSRKVLRNLPFAQRGYVFKSADLKKYYSEQTWYKPNPNYKGVLEDLSPEEQEWVKIWSEK